MSDEQKLCLSDHWDMCYSNSLKVEIKGIIEDCGLAIQNKKIHRDMINWMIKEMQKELSGGI